jgi:hypothetical protein
VSLTDNTVSTPRSSYKKSSTSTTKVPRLAGASNSIGTSNSKSSKSPASLGGRDDGKFFIGSNFNDSLID